MSPRPLSGILAEGSLLPLHGAPPGYAPLALATAAAAEPSRTLLWVLGDDRRLAAAAAGLALFAPGTEALAFPAWDCLPYDRVSPNPEVAGRRLATLARLADGGGERPRIVLATVNAVLQRVPARAFLAGKGVRIRPGAALPREELLERLAAWGYRRASTVMEPGEFAPRGSLLDLFPAGHDGPVRIDFFGDEVEDVRAFEPDTQRTAAAVDEVGVVPFSEVPWDGEGVRRFREGYRAAFGPVTDDDPLFEAVSGGVPYPGAEHWLPLFHERLETLFDHVGDAPVVLEGDFRERVEERWENIRDYLEARAGDGGRGDAPPYRPLPPERLHLPGEELFGILAARPAGVLDPFAPAPGAPGVDLGGRPGRIFAGEGHRGPDALLETVAAHVGRHLADGRRVAFACHSRVSRRRLEALLRRHGLPGASAAGGWTEAEDAAPGAVPLLVASLEAGFESERHLLVAEADVFGPRDRRPPAPRRRAEEALRIAAAIEVGDLLVHVEHGIGRYEGLETVDAGGAAHDCLRLRYRGGDRLFVPVETIDLVSRYGRAEGEGETALDRLGGAAWGLRKGKVRERLLEMAGELIRLAARRSGREAPAFAGGGDGYEAFCAAFPYEETDDQLETIRAVEGDLGRGRPMDRLVCGDVGFGKTEVALRAAHMVADAGHQVAVVVPTTLLARQHAATFRERFAAAGVEVAQLSRLTPRADRGRVTAGLADGSIPVVVGTHALLAEGIRFASLGLLVVDEEQHFGVAQKERLKELRAEVHVLTLTATPIPRTLHMALSGVRDLSLITTPPVDRLAIRTYVTPFDPVTLGEAIRRERGRGGQTFCVVPRIRDIPAAERDLRGLAPDARIAVAHGRMAASVLDETMTAFDRGEYDVLLSTSIIESGLDMPNANTLIVLHADRFGLAQLYQLRGRIGRRRRRAYAYLTLGPGRTTTEGATRRLQVLQSLDGLGAGFTLASHDLDIRGAGNLLGAEQSGHIREVGVELYQQMLADAVAELRDGPEGGAAEEAWTPEVRIRVPSRIPAAYVHDLRVRLALYRRLAALEDDAGIAAFGEELRDRFGPLPPEAANLLRVMAIRLRCRDAGIERLAAGARGATLAFREGRVGDPERLLAWVRSRSGAEVRPDSSVGVRAQWKGAAEILDGALQLADALARLAGAPEGAREAASVR